MKKITILLCLFVASASAQDYDAIGFRPLSSVSLNTKVYGDNGLNAGTFNLSQLKALIGGGGSIAGSSNFQFTTIAQLRASSTANTSTIYYVKDIGKEGVFKYDSLDIITADNLGLCVVNTVGQRYKRLYSISEIFVSWFGAMPDDGVNDATILTNMTSVMPAMSIVKMAGGTYNLEGTFKILKDSVTIEGNGNTVLRLNDGVLNNTLNANAADGMVLAVGDNVSGTRKRNVRLTGLVIDGNSAGQVTGLIAGHGSYGIFLRSTDFCEIDHVRVFNTVGTAVYGYNSFGNTVHDFNIHDIGYYNIPNSGKNGIDFQGSNAAGTYPSYGNYNKIYNGTIRKIHDSGIGLSGVSNLLIDNIHIDSCPVAGVEGIANTLTTNVNVARNVKMSNSYITNCGDGFTINGQSQEEATLDNVTIENCGGSAVILSQTIGGKFTATNCIFRNWKQISASSITHGFTFKAHDVSFMNCNFSFDTGKTNAGGQWMATTAVKNFNFQGNICKNIGGIMDFPLNAASDRNVESIYICNNPLIETTASTAIRIQKAVGSPRFKFFKCTIEGNGFSNSRKTGTTSYITLQPSDTIENVSIQRNFSFDSSAVKKATNAVIINATTIIKRLTHANNDWQDLTSFAENINPSAKIITRNAPLRSVISNDRQANMYGDSTFVHDPFNTFVGIGKNAFLPPSPLSVMPIQRAVNGYGISASIAPTWTATANGDTLSALNINPSAINYNSKTIVSGILAWHRYANKLRYIQDINGVTTWQLNTTAGKNAGQFQVTVSGTNLSLNFRDSTGNGRSQVFNKFGGGIGFRANTGTSGGNDLVTVFPSGNTVFQNTSTSASDNGYRAQVMGGLYVNDSAKYYYAQPHQLAAFNGNKSLTNIILSPLFSIGSGSTYSKDTLKFNGLNSGYGSVGQSIRVAPTGTKFEWYTPSSGTGSGTVTSVGITGSDFTITSSPVTTSGNIGLSIANNAVTYAKFQQVGANSLVGNGAGSPANATNVTVGFPLSLTTGGGLSMSAANISTSGYLTFSDWSTFNGKENALTFTTPLTRSTNTIGIAGLTTNGTSGQYLKSIGTGWAYGGILSSEISSSLGYVPSDDAGVMHLAGVETATGQKTFSAGLRAVQSVTTAGSQPVTNFYNEFDVSPSSNTSAGYVARGAINRVTTSGSTEVYCATANTDQAIINSTYTTTPGAIGTRSLVQMADGGASLTTNLLNSYCSLAYPVTQNASSSSVMNITNNYNYRAWKPNLNLSGAFNITNQFGFYADDYFSGGSATNPEDGTSLAQAAMTNIFQFYAAGTQGTTSGSYFGNRVGIGFGTAPTNASSITALLHVGAPSSGDAIKSDGTIHAAASSGIAIKSDAGIKSDGDLSFSSSSKGIILKDASGACYRITVNTSGVLVVTGGVTCP